jgi:antirestriction protein ArdC
MSSAYEKITDKIIEQLEKGVVPWHKPWKVTTPRNLVSGKTYRGINVLLLGVQGFGCEYWATYRQINQAGGSVKRGEKGTPVVYANWFEAEDEVTGEAKKVPFLKQYFVFNLEQTVGIECEKPQ